MATVVQAFTMPLWLPVTGVVMVGEKIVDSVYQGLLTNLDGEESADRSILEWFPENGIECKLCMNEVSRDQLSLRLCVSASENPTSERLACLKENPICLECAERIRTQGRDKNQCPFCRQANVLCKPRAGASRVKVTRAGGQGEQDIKGEADSRVQHGAATSAAERAAAQRNDEEVRRFAERATQRAEREDIEQPRAAAAAQQEQQEQRQQEQRQPEAEAQRTKKSLWKRVKSSLRPSPAGSLRASQ
mmetsp:Transcript_8829/g.20856  ORF Transcript_8829/g.20856 Transcript_8829/m.20856 type:complete len:247 (+) Transcript_8829:105-845(+)